MAKSLYISTAEANSGKALLSLGIMEMLLRKSSKVGFFRPIISDPEDGRKDEDITLILEHFQLDMTYEEAYGFHRKEVNDLIVGGKYDLVLDTIIGKYKELENRFDFVLVEGSDYQGEGTAFEFNINAAITKNLGCPVLILSSANSESIDDMITPVRLSLESFQTRDCEVAGIIINKVKEPYLDSLMQELERQFSQDVKVLAALPYDKKIGSPSLRDVADVLKAEVLHGEDKLDNQMEIATILAMQMDNAMGRIKENSLIITPGDRSEIILASLQAHQSTNYPNISGILLSTGLKPSEDFDKLLGGLRDVVPILSVKSNTYETASALQNVNATMRPEDTERILHAKQLFEKYVDTTTFEERILSINIKGMTPKMFQYNLVSQAKQKKQRIVLPEAMDARILKATYILTDQEIADIILLGNPEEVKEEARTNNIDIDWDKVQVIDPANSTYFDDYVNTFYELRKSKGVNLEIARDIMKDASYFGTMMVYKGDADGMVSGAVNTTAHTIRPALQFVKTKPGVSVVSSVFFMSLPDKVLVYGDCAVNPTPNPEQLAEIAISSAETAIAFGIEPKIAMLSYSSGASGSGEQVEKVRAATAVAQEKRPDLNIEGPIQYDAAVDPTVGAKKMPGSAVAGQANVLVFPDLNTGNNTYKAVQRETGAIAIGPVLQGLNKPVNDLSRGALVEDIVNTVVITSIQAQKS
ncbi:phosphate acetyltransferase [Algivirga pacifica]|uniref:Phosphate acetyltransferase n=1 Tax=Algivirga pacifica TaxID=1162670 RepID=A0ABP9DQ63_9BACT